MSTHPVTGITTCTVAGTVRRLAFDMNSAAALHEAKGPDWNAWLVKRFLGEKVEGKVTRDMEPLTPGDTITVLHALLATDREDNEVLETEKTLRRAVSAAELPELQMVLLRVVTAGFGLPGEDFDALLAATARLDGPAAGTGTKPSRSRSDNWDSPRRRSGGQR